MSFLDFIINNLPGVAAPLQKKLSFKEKLKWTLIALVLFFVLGLIPLFGLGQNELQRFELLSIILGASFGSIISLGIGPIVTASIVLQLLNGSGIVKFDLQTPQGKSRFQGFQKLLAIFFILFEGAIYVFMGGLSPAQELIGTTTYFQLQLLLVFQLFLGGLLILFMDEIVTKWGFGSGISLFIAAGVSQSVFIRALSPLKAEGQAYIGAIPSMVNALINQLPTEAVLSASSVIATIVIFAVAVYVQAMKVEIPLSLGRVAGHGVRWPLHFVYTSNIPVILVSALFANFQLWGSLLQRWAQSSGSAIFIKLSSLFGTFSAQGVPTGGLIAWLSPVNVIEVTITQGFFDGFLRVLPQALVYVIFMIVGCVIFSWFWVQTSSMDAKSQAQQILNAGFIMPGFRRDTRILEHLLARKIGPLTILGAITVGLLAAIADLSGALTNGTGLLLTVMIIYRLYEDIAKQHMMDMNPMIKKFMGK
ncbi:preprotein translocase subunit SecY [Candidatus Woesearchaeota archaeon]|nr:preprotein translocase subunit SecY [Candidatus Woesearchaeota archaeon]